MVPTLEILRKKNSSINITLKDFVAFAEAENNCPWMSPPTNDLVGPGKNRERNYERDKGNWKMVGRFGFHLVY